MQSTRLSSYSINFTSWEKSEMNKKDSFVINLAEMTAGWSLLTGERVWDWAMAGGDIQIVTRAPQYFLFIRQKFGNF